VTDKQEELRYRRQVDAAGFSILHHALTVDRALSDGAFRVYALLLKYAQQKAACWPGVTRLAADLGKAERTVSRTLAELEGRGIITRERRYGRSSVTWIEDLEAVYRDPAKNGRFEQPFDPAKNGSIDPAKNGMTEEQQGKNNKRGVGDLSGSQQSALDALTGLGVEPGAAGRLAKKHDPATVTGWAQYAARAQGLTNRAAFVVAKLRAGDPPPPAEGDRDAADRRRYIEHPSVLH
jgi:DNA-binding transcriptional ArsR family regulator